MLNDNYPNPFNPSTIINYNIPENDFVKITIYDMMGRAVKTLVNGSQTAGYKSVQWNATNDRDEPVSRDYIYIQSKQVSLDKQKMVLLK